MKREKIITIQELIERDREKKRAKREDDFLTISYRIFNPPLFHSTPFGIDHIWGEALTDVQKDGSVFTTSTGNY